MVVRVRSLALFALLVVLAGCSLTGQSSTHANATPTGTATPTVLVNPCAFTGFPLALESTAAPVLERSAPPGSDTVGGGTIPLSDAAAPTPHYRPVRAQLWSSEHAGDVTVYPQGSGGEALSSPISGFPFAIAMVSPTDGWVVGGQDANAGELILHYQGGQWIPVGSPAHEPLHAIGMVSPTEGWAVGVGGLILHYTRGAWTVAVPPGRLPYVLGLDGISMVSTSEGWALGTGVYAGATTPIFVHYAQGQWSEVDPGTLPVSGAIEGISLVSAQEGWGVGFESLVHFQHGTREEDHSDEQDLLNRRVYFLSVSMVSASDGWAVGYTLDSDAAVVAHYCGGKWTPQLENGGALYSVTMVSPDEAWAVGKSILHYSKGQWSEANAPLQRNCTLLSISMDSPQDGWAAGSCSVYTQEHFAYSPVYLHYQNGGWNL